MNEPQAHREASKLFDEIADDYSARAGGQVCNTSSLSFARRQEIVEGMMAGMGANGVVLDFGMGPAVFAPAVVGSGCRYVGVDISPAMVEKARALNLPNCTFLQGDLETVARYRGEVDLVLMIGLIDYLSDPSMGLRKLAECVRPGGCLVLSFRNRMSLPVLLRGIARRLWRMVRRGRNTEKTAFAASVLENTFRPWVDLVPVLRAAGFSECEVRYLDCSPLFFRIPLTPLLWRLGRSLDRHLAGRATAWMCASGVLKASKR